MAIIPWSRSGERTLAQRGSDPFSYLRRQIDRVFDDVWSGVWPGRTSEPGGAGFAPVDVTETDKEIKVSAEIPGVEAKDLEVSVENGILTIKGEKKYEHEEEGKGQHRIERSYGVIERSITLPAEVEEGQAKAEYKNGVLRLSLPKRADAQSRRKTIPVT
jgi:HSP20 family protein